MGQELTFDDNGNIQGASLLDYFLPTAVETPHWELGETVTPSPHHPIGAKGVGESPNVGGVPAFSNAVIDAFAHHGITHLPMPHTAWRIWKTCHQLGLDR
jgi:carbon-monoxide dehydrogenase large subunit